jgi:hypothetical protein
MNLRELLERSLKEIDRQVQTTANATPEQGLIWTLAAQELSEIRLRLYRGTGASTDVPH